MPRLGESRLCYSVVTQPRTRPLANSSVTSGQIIWSKLGICSAHLFTLSLISSPPSRKSIVVLAPVSKRSTITSSSSSSTPKWAAERELYRNCDGNSCGILEFSTQILSFCRIHVTYTMENVAANSCNQRPIHATNG